MYTILRTEKADTQIRNIVYYIANDSGSVERALGVLDMLEKKIGMLVEQPYCAPKARQAELKRAGFRVLVAGRYLVFYKIRETDQTVLIYAVTDCRQDYVDLVL